MDLAFFLYLERVACMVLCGVPPHEIKFPRMIKKRFGLTPKVVPEPLFIVLKQ